MKIKAVRIKKLDALKAKGMDAYAQRFIRSHSIADILKDFKEGVHVVTAGRIMANRDQGKVHFMDLMDQTGRMQLFVKGDNIGADAYEMLKCLDLGDIIGVEGETFTTKTGQNSIRVSKYQVLAKSLQTMPEKWHGLKDVDIRYRQRYVDLIANPEVREVFIKRSHIVSYVRSFLDGKGFLEVETPMLQPMAGGARGKPFKSKHNALDMDVYLRIAPELYLKRLLVGGLEKVYEINRNFRNEGISTRHNPEFTMLEVYQSYGNFEDMMQITEELISSLVFKMYGTYKINYQGQEIDFTTPWERRSFAQVVKEHFDINPEDTAEAMLAKVKAKRQGSIKIDKLTRSAIMKIVEDVLDEKAISQSCLHAGLFYISLTAGQGQDRIIRPWPSVLNFLSRAWKWAMPIPSLMILRSSISAWWRIWKMIRKQAIVLSTRILSGPLNTACRRPAVWVLALTVWSCF